MIEITLVVAIGLMGGAFGVTTRVIDARRITAVALLRAGAYLMVR